MDIKVKLLREDGETKIWCKFFDSDDGSLINKEFSITYDEWDAIKKTRLDKNVWSLELPDESFSEQEKRIKWLLEPSRITTILKALNDGKASLDIRFYLELGGIAQEYQEKFNLTPFDFLQDAKIAKEVLQISLDVSGSSEEGE